MWMKRGRQGDILGRLIWKQSPIFMGIYFSIKKAFIIYQNTLGSIIDDKCFLFSPKLKSWEDFLCYRKIYFSIT